MNAHVYHDHTGRVVINIAGLGMDVVTSPSEAVRFAGLIIDAVDEALMTGLPVPPSPADVPGQMRLDLEA